VSTAVAPAAPSAAAPTSCTSMAAVLHVYGREAVTLIQWGMMEAVF